MQQQLAQMQQQAAPELQLLAQLDEPRIHWLGVVLGIGVVNILGLQAVLKVLQASRDSEYAAAAATGLLQVAVAAYVIGG
jgi:hypothetical protein